MRAHKSLESRVASSTAIEEILEAMPVAVIAIDAARNLRAANGLAKNLLGTLEISETPRGPGDLLNCLNAIAQPEGCGHSDRCHACTMWQSAEAAIAGSHVSQREVHVRTWVGQQVVERVFLISAGPLPQGALDTQIRALLVIEDVTHLHRLRGIIPICAQCKKIRNDAQAWQAVEKYIEDNTYASFTHSMCPTCVATLYPSRSQQTP